MKAPFPIAPRLSKFIPAIETALNENPFFPYHSHVPFSGQSTHAGIVPLCLVDSTCGLCRVHEVLRSLFPRWISARLLLNHAFVNSGSVSVACPNAFTASRYFPCLNWMIPRLFQIVALLESVLRSAWNRVSASSNRPSSTSSVACMNWS